MVEKGEQLQILTSGQLSIPAEPNNFGQMEMTKGTSSEHEMGVGWTEEVKGINRLMGRTMELKYSLSGKSSLNSLLDI